MTTTGNSIDGTQTMVTTGSQSYTVSQTNTDGSDNYTLLETGSKNYTLSLRRCETPKPIANVRSLLNLA